MHFSIVIPAYNEEGFISKTLESLYPQETTRGITYAIIVINNNSTDKTVTEFENFINKSAAKEVTILHEYVKGIVPARRAGAEKAIEIYGEKDHWIVTCDADSLYSKTWVTNFYNTIKNNPGVDFVHGSAKSDNTLNPYGKMLDRLGQAFKVADKLLERNKQAPIDDKVSCFSAKLYRETGGYSREYIGGVEQLAETWRLFIKAYLLGFKRAPCSKNASIHDGRRDTIGFLKTIRHGGIDHESYTTDIRHKDYEFLERINADPKKYITPEVLDDIVISRVAMLCFTFLLISKDVNLTGKLKDLTGDIIDYRENKSHKDLHLFKPSLVFKDALELASTLKTEMLRGVAWR